MLEADYQLIAVLKDIGFERAVDMDDAAQRTSLEVGATLMGCNGQQLQDCCNAALPISKGLSSASPSYLTML